MATIRERNGKFQVQVRLKGKRPITGSFDTKHKAAVWARDQEAKLRSNVSVITPRESKVTLREAIQMIDYAKTYDAARNHWLSDSLADKSITELTKGDALQWSQRQTAISPQTKAKYVNIPRMAWQYALEVLRLPLHPVNPFARLGIKKNKAHRQRRLRRGEEALLLTPVPTKRRIAKVCVALPELILWAIETGMRRGEILKIRQHDFSECGQYLHIPETKTDTPRKIPLTKKAQSIARGRIAMGFVNRLFPYGEREVTYRFGALCKLRGIVGLTFHDLRHEALSRFNEKGLSPFDIMIISGHTTTTQLKIYVQPDRKRVLEAINA